jgi:hypothetical protein
MIMGRSALPPEEAGSWGEFHARPEVAAAGRGDPLTPLWWALAGPLFGTGLICSVFAFQDGRWWLWLYMLAAVSAVGAMAAWAVERADRGRAGAGELGRMHVAWQDHLTRRPPGAVGR